MIKPTSSLTASLILIVQAVAAAYFLADGIDDLHAQWRAGPDLETVMETFVGLALVGGVVLGGMHLRQVREALRQREVALSGARGAMAELLDARFAEWGLSPAEAEVALFALKGNSIAEIAGLRKAAEGTVRSQLSQIYAKAEVRNQAMLACLFIDELIDPLIREAPAP